MPEEHRATLAGENTNQGTTQGLQSVQAEGERDKAIGAVPVGENALSWCDAGHVHVYVHKSPQWCEQHIACARNTPLIS